MTTSAAISGLSRVRQIEPLEFYIETNAADEFDSKRFKDHEPVANNDVLWRRYFLRFKHDHYRFARASSPFRATFIGNGKQAAYVVSETT